MVAAIIATATSWWWVTAQKSRLAIWLYEVTQRQAHVENDVDYMIECRYRCILSGSDWENDNQDGGPGSIGIVTGFREDDREVLVLWRSIRTRCNYRWGPCYEVRIVGHSPFFHVGDVVERGE